MGCTCSKRPGGRKTGGGRRPPASSHHLGRSDPSAEGAQHWLKPVQHAASPQPEAQQAETQRPSGGAAAASLRQPGEQPGSSIPPAAAAPQSLTRTCKPRSGPNPSIPADYGIPPDDPCTSPRESARLAALSSLRFVGAPTGPRFAAITALLRSVFEVPIANVYLMEEDSVLQVPDQEGGQWDTYPRCESACKWLMAPEQVEMLIVPDLAQDIRFHLSRWVQGPPHVRFYASAPLVSSDWGQRYGTLCIIDFQPRCFSAEQYQVLAHLAEIVVREVERGAMLRWRQLALEEVQDGTRRLARGLDCFSEGVLLFDSQREGWPVLYSNRAARELLEGPAAGGATASNCQIQAGVPLWQLLTPAPDVGVGAEEAVQKARKAVAAGQSVTLACHPAAGSLAAWSRSASNSSHSSAEGAAAAATAALGASGDFWRSSAAARGAVPATNVTGLQAQPSPVGRMASGGSTASWDDVERVLTGRASLDALLGGCHAASGSNQAACNGAQPPRLSVTLTCAAAPDCGSRHPAVGIPAANAVWSGVGSLHSSGACGSAAPSPASAAAPCRLWFAQISGTDAGSAALPQPGSCPAPCAASGGGVSEPALLAPWLMPAAHEGLLRPQELAGLQLGPLLGAGASGRTYRCLWYGSACAVKIVNVCTLALQGATAAAPSLDDLGSGDGGSAGSSAAPLLEALLSRALSHPHIVPAHAWGVSDGGVTPSGERHMQLWIVQTLCLLGTLSTAVDSGRFASAGGPAAGPDLPAVLRTAAEVAGALSYLHSRGVLHGDLTGNNVLLAPAEDDAADGRGYVAMVADFGLSRPTSTALAALPRSSYGTVAYMAPEQITDDEVSPAADVYALGVMLWEMLSGRRAWRGLHPLQIITAVGLEGQRLAVPDAWPPSVQALVLACLEQQPGNRPTAAAVLGSLHRLLAELDAGRGECNGSPTPPPSA